MEFGAEFSRRVLAGCEGHLILLGAFGEAEDIPAGIDIVEIRGDTAIDEFDADHVFERAAKRPAERIGSIVCHEITVTTIHCDSDGALFSGFAGGVRE